MRQSLDLNMSAVAGKGKACFNWLYELQLSINRLVFGKISLTDLKRAPLRLYYVDHMYSIPYNVHFSIEYYREVFIAKSVVKVM